MVMFPCLYKCFLVNIDVSKFILMFPSLYEFQVMYPIGMRVFEIHFVRTFCSVRTPENPDIYSLLLSDGPESDIGRTDRI